MGARAWLAALAGWGLVACGGDGAAPFGGDDRAVAANPRHDAAPRTAIPRPPPESDAGSGDGGVDAGWRLPEATCDPPTCAGDACVMRSMASGREHHCVVFADGTARCWGRNDVGQLGSGAFGDSAVAVPVVGLGDAARVAAGAVNTCALHGDGTVSCWGAPVAIGSAVASDRATPVPVAGLAGVVDLAVGDGHACAVLDTGALSCWGDNTVGQLGDPTAAFGERRVTPATSPALGDVLRVAAGPSHTCVDRDRGSLTPDGEGVIRSIACFGACTSGQTGQGAPCTAGGTATPFEVNVQMPVVALSGGEVVCAQLAEGFDDVFCWGHGDGIPRGVSRDTVSIGGECAVHGDGSASCHGIVGAGRTPDMRLERLAGVTEVSHGGGGSACARIDDRIFCEGTSAHGELGFVDPLEEPHDPTEVCGFL